MSLDVFMRMVIELVTGKVIKLYKQGKRVLFFFIETQGSIFPDIICPANNKIHERDHKSVGQTRVVQCTLTAMFAD